MRTTLGLGAMADGARVNPPEVPLATHADPSPSPLGKPVGAGDLFARLVVSARPRRRSGSGLLLSVSVHLALGAALVLVPLLSPGPPPPSPDFIRLLLYDPPPPPPPPPPRGSPFVREGARPRRAPALVRPEPDAAAERPPLVVPVETPPPSPESLADAAQRGTEPAGIPAGSSSGLAEGMEGGVEGGMVGGVPGGVPGGVIGGTGQGPVLDFDRPPRLLRQTKPRYPHDAFVKKVEGTVMVEFVIDVAGRIVNARVLRSVPLLDEAALETVREWLFAPALKGGRPVATVARAPITFRIY